MNRIELVRNIMIFVVVIAYGMVGAKVITIFNNFEIKFSFVIGIVSRKCAIINFYFLRLTWLQKPSDIDALTKHHDPPYLYIIVRVVFEGHP